MSVKKMFIIILVVLLLIPFAYSKDITLKFYSSSSPQSFTAYKGSYVDIPVVVVNQDTVNMICTTSSSLGSQSTGLLQGGYQKILYFRYTADNKIKNLQPASITFTTDCIGPAPYSCGILWSDTCRYVSSSFLHPVTINYALSAQDQKNKNILEDYWKNLADKVTDIDKKNQKINELITKTPNPILPKNAKEDNSENQKRINPISNRFQNVVKALEDEDYGIGSTITASADLTELSNADKKIADLTNSINANIERYKKIVNQLNSILTDISGKVTKLKYKFNNELIIKLDEVGKTTHSKITNYQFTDLDEAEIILQTYSKQKDDLLLLMEKNLNDYSNNGIGILTKQTNLICDKFNLCTTKNKIQSLNLETTKNFNDLCNSYDGLSNEIKVFNENEAKRYKSELDELNKKNQEIKNKNELIQKDIDKINKVNELKENLNSKVTIIEKDVMSFVKKVNSLGKSIDLSNYSKLVKEYNDLPLEKKEQKIKELETSANELKSRAESITSQEKGFTTFFKKIYYTVFGKKQELEYKLKLETKELVPNLLPEIPNNIKPAQNVLLEEETTKFFSDACQISEKGLSELKAHNVDIRVSEKESQIKKDVKEPEKTCIDENGQRTANCCNDDSFRNRKDLYPIVFVHGHASETGQKTIQNSLDTFSSMSSYFVQRGYIIKDILYPEKTTELTKGVWPYCKPVAVRVTYYEGIINGGAVQYKSSIGDYAPTLSKEIDAVLTATNKDKAIIVSHSMGGIISRYYILKNDGQSKIYRLITISSPHYGTRDWISFLSGIGGESESKEMKPGSDFLNNLNLPSDSLVETYSIMGDSKTCVGGECDGVLYVEEAKLKNGKDFIIFKGPKYEHSNIVLQQDVAQKVLDIIKS